MGSSFLLLIGLKIHTMLELICPEDHKETQVFILKLLKSTGFI